MFSVAADDGDTGESRKPSLRLVLDPAEKQEENFILPPTHASLLVRSFKIGCLNSVTCIWRSLIALIKSEHAVF